MSEQPNNIRWRLGVVYLCVLVVAFAIIWQMLVVYYGEGDQWRASMKTKTVREVEIVAKRGTIYSVDSCILVMTKSIFTVRMDLHESVVSKDTFDYYVKALADSLALLSRGGSATTWLNNLKRARTIDLGTDLKTKKKRGRGERDFLIARNIDYPTLKRIEKFPILRKGRYSGGLLVEERDQRVHLYNMLAANTIGYSPEVNRSGKGLELAYDPILAGKNGFRIERKIANNVWRPISNENYELKDGKDIVTTINMQVQDVAESALQRCLEQNAADHGCAILMEVATGEIRAIATLKRGEDGKYREVYNYAIGESSEPGSTFKLASLIAILEEGKIDTNFIVPTGSIVLGGRKIQDSHEKGWGKVSLKRAFALSSNVGMAYAAEASFNRNHQRYCDYFYAMRLDKPLGIDLKGEGLPLIKSPNKNSTVQNPWSGWSLYQTAMGYEVQLTPLQLLTFYNAVANNGRMMKPMFVREIQSGGRTLQTFQPTILQERICSNRTLTKVQECLEEVVQHGTAHSLSKSAFKIAGKTGTAQINYKERGGERWKYLASFVGYFPADAPLYTCAVIVSNPTKNRQYGAEVAAPVFREIADKVYSTHLRVEKVLPDVATNSPLIPVSNAGDVRLLFSQIRCLQEADLANDYPYWSSKNNGHIMGHTVRANLVPNVKGMNVKDAAYLLEKSGLTVRINGKGAVVEQSITAGSAYSANQTIWLRLSTN